MFFISEWKRNEKKRKNERKKYKMGNKIIGGNTINCYGTLLYRVMSRKKKKN